MSTEGGPGKGISFHILFFIFRFARALSKHIIVSKESADNIHAPTVSSADSDLLRSIATPVNSGRLWTTPDNAGRTFRKWSVPKFIGVDSDLLYPSRDRPDLKFP